MLYRISQWVLDLGIPICPIHLSKNNENVILTANNSLLGAQPISVKMTLQESQKFLDPSTTSNSSTDKPNINPEFNTITVDKKSTLKGDVQIRKNLTVSGTSTFAEESAFLQILRTSQIKSLSDDNTSITEPSQLININSNVINIGNLLSNTIKSLLLS